MCVWHINVYLSFQDHPFYVTHVGLSRLNGICVSHTSYKLFPGTKGAGTYI